MERVVKLTAEHLGKFSHKQVLGWNVHRKWPTLEGKEEWYTKQTMARRKKLIKLFNQQEGKCCYCGVECTLPIPGVKKQPGGRVRRTMATLEHIKPQAEGGTDSMKNLLMACNLCNSQRGVVDFIIFKEARSTPEKWKAYNLALTKKYQVLSVAKKAKKAVRQQEFIWKLGLLLYLRPEWQVVFSRGLEEFKRNPEKARQRLQTG